MAKRIPAPKVEAPKVEAPKAFAYAVAEGKAITSRRKTILADGDEIRESDLAGGKEALDAFVKSGHIVKNR